MAALAVPGWPHFARLGAAVALVVTTVLMGLAHAAPRFGARAADVAEARDYVLASCLITRYPDSPIAADAEAWARALVDRGHIPGELYPDLARLGREGASASKLARDGTPMHLQACMALYNSLSLKRQIQRLLPRS